MGFSIVLEVIGKCDSDTFLRKCQEHCTQPTEEEKDVLKEWIVSSSALTDFFKDLKLSFDDYYVSVVNPESEHTSWLFFEILLSDFAAGADNSYEYCKVFEQLEEIISLDEADVEILIHRESSYKGGDELDVDYEEIASAVNSVKANYDMIVHTTLTMK